MGAATSLLGAMSLRHLWPAVSSSQRPGGSGDRLRAGCRGPAPAGGMLGPPQGAEVEVTEPPALLGPRDHPRPLGSEEPLKPSTLREEPSRQHGPKPACCALVLRGSVAPTWRLWQLCSPELGSTNSWSLLLLKMSHWRKQKRLMTVKMPL